MTITLLLLAASVVWGCSEAQSGDTSATMSTAAVVEQYCFPKSGSPFFSDSMWPSVTMMYSGITLTTAPLTFTASTAGPSIAPGLSSGSPAGSANSAAASSVTNAPPVPEATDSRMEDAAGSPSSGLSAGAGTSGSLASTMGGNTQASSSNLRVSSSAVSVMPTSAAYGSDGVIIESGQLTASPSATGISDDDQPVDDSASPTKPASSSANIGASGAPVATTATSRIATAISSAAISQNGNTLAGTGIGSGATSSTGTQASVSAGLYGPTAVPPGPDANEKNDTVSLSPSSVDALQLALFLKNLGASVFNQSKIVLTPSLAARADTNSLASLIAEIEMQEQTQSRTLRSWLHHSGNPDVPSCRYILPSSEVELRFLMRTLKSISLGVLMSIAESADRTVAIMLSSIASVDAKHLALLDEYTHSNTSGQSFDTPATPTWAYNFALEYVQPGSCSLELPLPILPKLTINKETSGHVYPGTDITVEWDAAASAAVSRSGNPLFVAWVNQVAQPVYTALTLVGKSSGKTSVPLSLSGTAFAVLTAQPKLTSIADLTEATLAGPIVLLTSGVQ